MNGKLSEWRRTLHQFPELSFQEFQTADFIASVLSTIDGIAVERGIGLETSVIATLGKGEGPVIALRADIDALPIDEANTCDYRSKTPGVMHACGHDAHAAILLGAASLLAEYYRAEQWNGTVKFIFQPAEETIDEDSMSGSPYLLQAGAYDGVELAIALHMCPWLAVGEVQLHDGISMANVDVFHGVISGTGGHGAYPELGSDPTWMLGLILQALHGIVPRKISALEPAVVSVGQIHAGTASNIIPHEVQMEGTVRSYSANTRDLLETEIRDAFALAKHLGGDYSFHYQRGEPALVNDRHVNEQIAEAIQKTDPSVRFIHQAFGMGGEDFAYVTQQLPGAMFFLGCSLDDGIERDLHTPHFDIDERSLPLGAAILANAAIGFFT
ncbi:MULTISPECIES: M20 family metallopeptidase [unclassified Planococcus (in: firmicutes)]|uniref:M20 metallopeptidase family protein n=1 Tax=unclassified Planococcus (in: firmicutes) TaxID=2662419 RepID=UPI0020B3648E|nr:MULTISPECIES: M20 family metallopeptidase [unclassified Planococcus (in: firmicutes)]